MSIPEATASDGNHKQNGRVLVWSIVSLLIGLLVGHVITHHFMGHHAVRFSTPYQGVLLSNGAVYYGKLSGFGGRNVVLDDVYYILTKTDPETKQVSNILVKRGKELHEPDKMYINADQIVFVEPVGPSSKVAQLIKSSGQ